jgi:hypothetical protein
MDDFQRWAMCQAHLYNAVSSMKAAFNYLTNADHDEYGDELAMIYNHLVDIVECMDCEDADIVECMDGEDE